MKEKTCCFAGHQPQFLPWEDTEASLRRLCLKERLRKAILRMITEEGVRRFLSGMNLGVDTWAAEIVLELKTHFPVFLECVLPSEELAIHWTESDRNRFFSIVSHCDHETMLQTHYTVDCFRRCSRYMVDSSDFVIAVWSGAPGNTADTIAYARKKGRNVILIAP